MLSMLVAYDADGNVVAVLDHMVARNASGEVVGLIDFAAHEDATGAHTDIWHVANAKGSKVWPEWLGGRAHDFRVELEGPPGAKRIGALVHATSGHRRERAACEDACAAVEPDASGARDIRHIVGGPGRPLHLDDEGRTIGPDHPAAAQGTPAHLPLVGQPVIR